MAIATLSFGLIVTTSSCSDDNPEVVVGDKGDKGDKGETGPQGSKGERGEQGNANVKRFSFEVKASEWSGGHYGANNNHNHVTVDASLTGGISMNTSNYVTIVFARPADSYSEYKQLPYRFSVDDNYAILLEFIPNRAELTMSKTTNGINTSIVPLSETPSKISFTVIMIEISAANAAKGKVNFDNYNKVSSYFKLE